MIRANIPQRDAEWLIAHLLAITETGQDHDAAHADAVLLALGVFHRAPVTRSG